MVWRACVCMYEMTKRDDGIPAAAVALAVTVATAATCLFMEKGLVRSGSAFENAFGLLLFMALGCF